MSDVDQAATVQHRIAVVDDTEANRFLLQRIFSGAGYTAIDLYPSAAAALEGMSAAPPDLVLLDLHMPGEDGFHVLERLPATRSGDYLPVIVITADQTNPTRDRALSLGAHDFLTKPVDVTEVLLRSANQLRVRQLHRRTTELLERTLAESVRTLLEVLALADPEVFARVSRLRQLAVEIGTTLDVPDRWALEMAAGLSQLAAVSLSRDLVRKVSAGLPLTPAEQAQIDEVPDRSVRLLARIPQLDPVRDDIRLRNRDAATEPVPPGARVLRLVLELEILESRGLSRADALGALRDRGDVHDPAVLDALYAGGAPQPGRRVETTLSRVRPGSRLVHDLRDGEGRLLVAEGQELTTRVLDLLRGGRLPDSIELLVIEPGPDPASLQEEYSDHD